MAGKTYKQEPVVHKHHRFMAENPQSITLDIWHEKYRRGTEATMSESKSRVAMAIANKSTKAFEAFENTLQQNLLLAGGRINAGAGSGLRVTLMNCYVSCTIPDSMQGIADALKDAMLTMQQGGGIGMDFSSLRPEDADLNRTGAPASGPGPFMDMWDAMCRTIMSAGFRRGAMMGTLCDSHPFLPKFIIAKQDPNRWRNFNVSVLISDAFIDAVRYDEEWALYFPCIPHKKDHVGEFTDEDGITQYIYSKHQARDLWNAILQNTYDYAEPGVIFIDRINDLNNLQYCETISCTNPCVTGDTKILTSMGYKEIADLVDCEVSIWNGEFWSTVKPFPTGINPIFEVTFTNGSIVKCTTEHKWELADGTIKSTKDLKSGDPLCEQTAPPMSLTQVFSANREAYTQGFYAGDGTRNSHTSKLYAPKYCVQHRLEGTFSKERTDRSPLKNWYHGRMLSKLCVPSNSELTYKLEWLAGLLDADASLNHPGKGARPVLQLVSAEVAFLNDIQMMLFNMDIHCKVHMRNDGGKKTVKGVVGNFRSTRALVLNITSMHKLVSMGLHCERVDTSLWAKAPEGKAYVPTRVKSVVDLGIKAPTYCFTEPLRNMGVFNGVLGHNCGEQPLPPYGACDLGAVNLAVMVDNPFEVDSQFRWDLLKSTVHTLVEFLDNVIDVTGYPLEQQEKEQQDKRRIGLGITGLADAMVQLRVRYGSQEAVMIARKIMRFIAHEAYTASALLAKERGTFTLYDEKWLEAPFVQKLDTKTQTLLKKYGSRNGVILTIAPVGTGSIYYGNISSGLEPIFAHEQKRNVRQADDSWKEYLIESYAFKLYKVANDIEPDVLLGQLGLPDYMATAQDITVDEHLNIQAAIQEWVDASVSKTINCPKDLPFNEFAAVYDRAYDSGCKGCTTYRPSGVRGQILSIPREAAGGDIIPESKPDPRPEVLSGKTYKIKWPSLASSLYLTVNRDEHDQPFEVFISSKSSVNADWMTAVSLLITAIMRMQKGISFLPEELKSIYSAHDGAWIEGKYYGSLIGYIGHILERALMATTDEESLHDKKPPSTTVKYAEGPNASWASGVELVEAVTPKIGTAYLSGAELCPKCGNPALVHQEGCKVCRSCGFSSCD